MAELKAGPAPTGRDKIFDALYGVLGGKPENRWAADKLTSAIDFGTLGMLTGAYDGGRELAETGRPGALAMALMPGAKVAAPAAQAATKGIRAFHGSPHDFDRFDLSKIGSGEGAQAYGHGLYFAESEGVAKSYKDQLGNYENYVRWEGKSPPTAQQQSLLNRLSGPDQNGAMTVAKLRRELLRGKMDATDGMFPDAKRAARYSADLEELQRIEPFIQFNSPGRMYEVNIKASPDEFLDWDKPLRDQPQQARAVLEPKLAEDYYDPNAPIGQILQRDLLKKDAVQPLREAGIPGIKYLDQGSRTAGEGSRNYVVFDDALIEIMRKYGLIPPAAGAGLAAALQSDPAQATP